MPAHPHHAQERSAPTLVHLQYLRGLAALMVVVHHVVKAREGFFSPLAGSDFGRAGVLIFFVLSGFIIAHVSSADRPAAFALRRVVRVVPLYWVLTLVFFAIQVRHDPSLAVLAERAPELLASLFFVPHMHETADRIWPILVPGWTLNYEMFFFALFLAGLVVGRPRRVVPALIAALVIAGLALPGSDPRWVTWTSPLLLLFVVGIALAEAWRRWDLSRAWPALPLGAVVLAAGAVGVAPGAAAQPTLAVGAALVTLGTLGCQARWPERRVPLLGPLGDASYSLYLSHTIALIVLLKILGALPLGGWSQFAVVTTLAVGACWVIGLLCYRWIERPMLHSHRRIVARILRPAPPSAAGLAAPPAGGSGR
ncbi:Acyltransferase family protein [Roseivivax jejudonensis]|uniref:Acyltransferase family protein n=1 Tax=Roseivivax jejudonensis TaxID=1529041 RepID=A0A1X6ZKR3_9RHOB|nr:acyltransferase [Roseivivax jejudonensis]SLN53649.1 Acyltransferase family protein [Roseivivax jejudonensis]